MENNDFYFLYNNPILQNYECDGQLSIYDLWELVDEEHQTEKEEDITS